MRRRAFWGVSAGAAAGLTGFAGCGSAAPDAPGQAMTVLDNSGKLGGKSLETLREQYRYDLFDDFLTFMDSFVIDHEFGGFMCNTDRAGKNISTSKSAWYEGRGIWVYSYLYNKVESDPKYIKIADKSVEFILKHKPDGDAFWQGTYTREGKASGSGDIYGNLFIANGLAEYSKAPDNERYWDMAKEILLTCMKRYDSLDYSYDANYASLDVAQIVAPRVLGHWMVLIRLVTQMLELRADTELESLADRCVEAIMNYHFNPEFDLLNESLNHDMSRPDSALAQFVYTGHAIETLWMLLYEAARRKDETLFDKVADSFRCHVEVAWDDVYGGVFRSLDNVNDNVWTVDKVLWAQEEVLIGSLFIIEHTGEEWAKEMFAKMFSYVQDKYPLKQYGYPIWIL
ncbi:AGE family epimerase/isomerase, partial [Candidatus Latescibacterota bacterium]